MAITGWPSCGEHVVDERQLLVDRQALEVRAEDDRLEVLARVGRLDRPGLQPGPDVGEAGGAQALAGLAPASRSSTGRASRAAPGDRRPRSPPPRWRRSRSRRTGPTAGRPGASASYRRANSVSWSPIQWKVAVERIASTGCSSLSSSRSCANASTSSPRRSLACSTIARLPSTAITLPSGTRSSSSSVTRPVPQPASSTRSSPRRSRRSMTSRAIVNCGSDCRSYEAAFHSRGGIRLYVIAYGGQLHWVGTAAGRRRGRRRRLRAVGAVARLVALRALRLGAPAAREVLHEAVERLLLVLAGERLLDLRRGLGERQLGRRRDPGDGEVVVAVRGLDRALDLVLLRAEHRGVEVRVERALGLRGDLAAGVLRRGVDRVLLGDRVPGVAALQRVVGLLGGGLVLGHDHPQIALLGLLHLRLVLVVEVGDRGVGDLVLALGDLVADLVREQVELDALQDVLLALAGGLEELLVVGLRRERLLLLVGEGLLDVGVGDLDALLGGLALDPAERDQQLQRLVVDRLLVGLGARRLADDRLPVGEVGLVDRFAVDGGDGVAGYPSPQP